MAQDRSTKALQSDPSLRDRPVSPQVARLEDAFIGTGYGHIGLLGVRNARDLGGMPTQDGHVIRHGVLLRTGQLGKATASDAARLRGMGLSVVVDFRTQSERARSPEPMHLLPEASMEFVPVIRQSTAGITQDKSLRSLIAEAKAYDLGGEDKISGLYATIVTSELGRQGYRRFFEILLEQATNPKTFVPLFIQEPAGSAGAKAAGAEAAGAKAASASQGGAVALQAPQKRPGCVLWHCSAGKDRTGIAAAFLELVLGVSPALVIEDYLASNRYVQPGWSKALMALGRNGMLPSAAYNLLHLLYTVEEQSIVAAFDAIEQEWGSFYAYCEQELNLDAEKIAQLRAAYLVRP